MDDKQIIVHTDRELAAVIVAVVGLLYRIKRGSNGYYYGNEGLASSRIIMRHNDKLSRSGGISIFGATSATYTWIYGLIRANNSYRIHLFVSTNTPNNSNISLSHSLSRCPHLSIIHWMTWSIFIHYDTRLLMWQSILMIDGSKRSASYEPNEGIEQFFGFFSVFFGSRLWSGRKFSWLF